MGLKVSYCALSASVSEVRCGRPVPKNWKKEVEADYNGRKPNR